MFSPLEQPSPNLVIGVLLVYKTAEALLEPSVRVYIYIKMCANKYGADSDVCLPASFVQNTVITKEQDDVQKAAAEYMLFFRLLINVPTIMLTFLLGIWSDRVGRKLPMTLPSIGAIISVFLFVASTQPQASSLNFILIGAGVYGVFGKSIALTMACSSYIVDETTESDRTKYLGRLLGMNYLGEFLGSLLIGLLFTPSHLHLIYMLVAVLNGTIVCVVIFMVKESTKRDVDEITNQGDPFHMSVFFNRSIVCDSLAFLFAPRISKNQGRLCFFMAMLFVHLICKVGEQDTLLLLVERAPFEWSGGMYGLYLTAYYGGLSLALLVVLPVVMKCCRPADTLLIILGLTMSSVRLLLVAFGTSSWMLFVGAAVGSAAGFITTSTKSIVSRIVNDDEIGRSFSLLACCEAIASLVGPAVFDTIYVGTESVFPGFTFVIEACIYFSVVFFVLRIHFDITDEE